MKKIGKVLVYTFITFILVLVLLIVVAALSEKRIVQLAINQVSKTINIPIQVDDIEFTLIHNFPYATIQCHNFMVSSPQTIENEVADTLFFAERLFVSVASRPLLKNIFDVRKVEIENAEIYYRVDTAGVSNFDFLIDTTQPNVIDTAGNDIFLEIEEFTLNSFTCYYRDEKQNASANLLFKALTLSGVIDNNRYQGDVEGIASLSNCRFGNTNVYKMQNTDLDFKLAYNEERLSIDHVGIAVDDDALLSLQGSIFMGDRFSSNMELKAEKLELGNLLKYVPESYLSDFGIRDLSGLMTAEAKVSGLLLDSVMPAIETTFNLSNGSLQYQDYPQLKSISLSGKATNGIQQNNVTSSIDIQSLNFQTDNSKISLNGNVTNLDKPAFSFNSTIDLDLTELVPFIPDTLLQSLDGKILAKISSKGVVPDSISEAYFYSVLADTKFSLQAVDISVAVDSSMLVNHINGQVDYRANEIKIKHFNAVVPSYGFSLNNLDAVVLGNPEIPDSLNIRFNQLQASFDKSTLELHGTIKNPKTPDYSISGSVNLDLEEISKFLPDSLVNSISGNVFANFQSAAHLNLDSLSNQIYELLFEKSSYSAKFEEISVDMPDTVMNVSHLSGQLNYQSDTFQIDQLGLNYQGMQLDMNDVTASNIYSAVLQNQAKELNVKGNFNVDDLDYAVLEKFMQYDTTRAEELEVTPLNFSYKIKGRFTGNSIKYGDALFQDIDTKFLLKTSYFVFDSLKMNAFEGQSLSSVKIQIQPEEKIDIYFKTDISKMNVSKMIKGFHQYIEYEDLKSENVQGVLSTQMDGKIVLQDFEPVYNSLLLNGNLTVENGALINIKPIMEVEKIKGIGLKNMDSLYFSTLNSSVFLFNREIYIPRTEIKSSSFDAMFLGMYSFGEDYEYHIRMFLGEVLSSKSKENLRKQAQADGFGDDVEMDEKTLTKGRTSIYLVSKSEDGKEKAGFDTKHERTNMKAKVNLQKQMVDMRFHPALVKYNTEE
jgi:uncharacterized protein involved in outer membrane biogenesis